MGILKKYRDYSLPPADTHFTRLDKCPNNPVVKHKDRFGHDLARVYYRVIAAHTSQYRLDNLLYCPECQKFIPFDQKDAAVVIE